MKKQIVLAILAAGLLVGCKQLKDAPPPWLATPNVTELPGQYKTIATVVNNGDGTFSTNYTTVPVTSTNWVVNPGTKAIVDTAGGFIPVYGQLAAAFLGLIGWGYTAWLNRRNKSIAVSTIQGVEVFRDQLKASGPIGQKLDEKLVNNLKYIHAAAKVSDIAQELVDASTKSMPEVSVAGDASVSKILEGK